MKQKLFDLLNKKKTKDFLIYGVGQGVNILTPLLITPYLIYICGLEHLGIIAISQSLAYILIVIVDYSSYIVGVKETSLNRDKHAALQNIFNTTYFAKFLLLLLVFILATLLIFSIPYFRNYSISFFLSLSIIVAQFVNPTWFLQGIEDFLWITIINITSKLLYVIGIYAIIQTENDYIYANFILGVAGTLANGIGFVWIVKKYNFSIRTVSIDAVKSMIQNHFMFCVSQLFFSIRNYSSVLIVGFFAGNYVAGQFKLIEQIINLLRTYLQMFFKFSYSYICFEIDKNFLNGIAMWKKFNGANSLLLCVLLATLYVFSEQVLRFFNVAEINITEFVSYLHIAILIPLLIGITLPLEQLLFSLNKNKQYIRITIISTILNAIGLAIAMLYFGLQEAFYILIVTELTLVITYYLILKPYLKHKATVAA